MTDSQSYNGTGKLAEAIANLCGLSPKSQGQIAALIKQAKIELGITSKAKNLPDDVKLAIWRWHYCRLHPVTVDTTEVNSHDACLDAVELFSRSIQPDTVDIISQHTNVDLFSHPESSASVELYSHVTPSNELVDIISHNSNTESVEIISQINDLDIVRVAFYVAKDGAKSRQVIALDDFYINGLIAAAGITKADVPKWVQSAVDSWGAFDVHLPITKQVKFLIIQTITQALDEARKQL